MHFRTDTSEEIRTRVYSTPVPPFGAVEFERTKQEAVRNWKADSDEIDALLFRQECILRASQRLWNAEHYAVLRFYTALPYPYNLAEQQRHRPLGANPLLNGTQFRCGAVTGPIVLPPVPNLDPSAQHRFPWQSRVARVIRQSRCGKPIRSATTRREPGKQIVRRQALSRSCDSVASFPLPRARSAA